MQFTSKTALVVVRNHHRSPIFLLTVNTLFFGGRQEEKAETVAGCSRRICRKGKYRNQLLQHHPAMVVRNVVLMRCLFLIHRTHIIYQDNNI